MNITSWLAAVRRYFDDDAKRLYSDQDLITSGDLEARSMFRTFTHASTDWHNCLVFLDPTTAKQLGQTIFQWRLPTWVAKVAQLHRREAVPMITPGEPYRNPQTGNKLLEKIDPTDERHKRGWDWDGQHTLTFWGETSAPYLALKVAKIPHRMFQARIATVDSGGAGQLIIPSTLVGEEQRELGGYINAEIEVVSTADPLGTHLGEVRRCVWSSPVESQSGARVHRLFLDAPFSNTLAQEDVVETYVPVPEDFIVLHVLRTVQATLPKKPNMELLRVIAPRLAEEEKRFNEYAQPKRDGTGPFFKVSRWKQLPPRDPDVYPFRRAY